MTAVVAITVHTPRRGEVRLHSESIDAFRLCTLEESACAPTTVIVDPLNVQGIIMYLITTSRT